MVGDILKADWGLAPNDAAEIARDVDVIIHNAADTSFAANDDTGKTNVDSVPPLLDFAKRCARKPLIVYMSTATNIGAAHGACVGENDGCKPDAEHYNEYTKSKAVAERMLADSGLPVLVLRPTIVLSSGLPDKKFARQILWCAPLTRIFESLPIGRDNRLDIVDVGYVAECTIRLLQTPNRAYDCYHLSAGAEGATTVETLRHLVHTHYRRTDPIRLVQYADWSRADYRAFVRSPLQRDVFRSLRHYFPFLNMDVTFDNSRLAETLGAALPELAPIDGYFRQLLSLIRTKAALLEAAMP